jgi:hypothetical protein
MSEWSLLFRVHGMSAFGEVEGVQSRKMRSYFFPIIFQYCFFSSIAFYISKGAPEPSSHTPLWIVASSILIRIDRAEASRRLGRGLEVGD